MKIAINGDLGSGKSRLARALAAELGADYVSSGEIQRRLALKLGLSTLALNLRAETDPSVDALIDRELARLAASSNRLILDSRLAFHLVPQATSIHLVAHPVTAARRLAESRKTKVETYTDADDALHQLTMRHGSEKKRFRATQGVELDDLSCYNLVVQTDLASKSEVFELCLRQIQLQQVTGPESWSKTYLNARMVLPTGAPNSFRGEGASGDRSA